MKLKWEQLKNDALAIADKISDRETFETLKTEWLGRKGKIGELMKEMSTLASEEKKAIGAIANEVKQTVESAFVDVEDRLKTESMKAQSKNEWIDVTQTVLPNTELGHVHPVTQVQIGLEKLFTSMGFIVEDGPELESDYFNFTALNILQDHPARDMQDTFYIEGHSNFVMRTHTSPVQIRSMRKYGAPLRMIVPGRCFRNESTDVRHEHTFHQLEGIVIGEKITFADMKGVFQVVVDHLFGKGTKIRLMPKFYPFVEPGVRGELECFLCRGKGCRVCKNTGWLEVMPGGMIHPNVLREGGIDPEKYSGFAFGFGLTRLVMLKYGIDDVRNLEGGDLRFLKQF